MCATRRRARISHRPPVPDRQPVLLRASKRRSTRPCARPPPTPLYHPLPARACCRWLVKTLGTVDLGSFVELQEPPFSACGCLSLCPDFLTIFRAPVGFSIDWDRCFWSKSSQIVLFERAERNRHADMSFVTRAEEVEEIRSPERCNLDHCLDWVTFITEIAVQRQQKHIRVA